MAVLLNRRSPWWYWLTPAAIYLLAILPAWLAGWPAYDLLMVYIRQAQYVPPNGVAFVSTASNPWVLFRVIDYDVAVRSYWIGFLAAAAATMVYLVYFARKRLSKNDLVVAAVLSAAMLPFFLPGMHERFFALAEIAAFCWALAARSQAAIAVAALLQTQLVLAYFGWVWTLPELTIVGAALVTVALSLLLLWSAQMSRIAATGTVFGPGYKSK
jgi:hypothetical protein